MSNKVIEEYYLLLADELKIDALINAVDYKNQGKKVKDFNYNIEYNNSRYVYLKHAGDKYLQNQNGDIIPPSNTDSILEELGIVGAYKKLLLIEIL